MQIRACYTGQVRFLLPVVGKQRYQERLDVPKSRFISFCDPTDVCKKGVATNMQIRACYAGKSGFYSRSSGSKIPRKTRCPKNQDSYYSVIQRTCAKRGVGTNMQIRACYTGRVSATVLLVVGKQRYQERLDVPKIQSESRGA
ncbi:uncharacterized protein LOC135350464 isoform X3 [Halichondria panicea]|uniref:uncharacterized protein LOC135350464 isoform X3 n=1 Tax=Halichondria panicea TaxID=6063 RepID=UPI00312BC32E